MRTTLGKLAKLSAVYAIGDIVTRGAALLLLPLYTRFLSPEDYGIVGVAEMIKQVLQMLLTLGATGIVIRFYAITTNVADRRRLFGTLWLLLICLPGLACLALLTVGRPLLETLFVQLDVDRHLTPTLLTTFLISAFLLIPPGILRAREQAVGYVAFSLGLFASSNLAILWQVVLLGRGAEGYLTGQLIGAGLMAIIATGMLLREVTIRPAWRYVAPMLAYGLPLVPHYVGHWALGLSDRLILERFVSLTDLGLYTLAYQIGLVAQLLVQAVNNALLPMFGRAATDEGEFARLPQVATYAVFAEAAAVLALALAAPSLVQLVTPPNYHSAGMLAIPILLGYLAFGLYGLPMNGLAQMVGQTRLVPLLTLSAAGVNIGLNLLLVPRYGVWAAAFVSLVGYLVLLLLVWMAAQRARPLPYEYGRIGKILLAMLASLGLGMLLLRQQPLINILLIPVPLLMMLVFLYLLGFWTPRERDLLSALRARIAARFSHQPW